MIYHVTFGYLISWWALVLQYICNKTSIPWTARLSWFENEYSSNLTCTVDQTDVVVSVWSRFTYL